MACGESQRFIFSDRSTGWKYMDFNCGMPSWKGTDHKTVTVTDHRAGKHHSISADALAPNTPESQRICCSCEKLALLTQTKLLMRALSYSAGVFFWSNTSACLLIPQSDFPPLGEGGSVMLALTVEIQPVQWKRGWQLEKIHSQSERSAEAGMPTFQSSDRSSVGSVPGL